MIDLSRVRNYYVACGYTDLRRGIDGLAEIVIHQYGTELDEESLFLFCGRRTDRIKALYFSGDGYILLYKRLNNGRFQWPRSEAELRKLDAQAFRWLMEGLEIAPKKAIRNVGKKICFNALKALKILDLSAFCGIITTRKGGEFSCPKKRYRSCFAR